jgi:hypothetical protein
MPLERHERGNSDDQLEPNLEEEGLIPLKETVEPNGLVGDEEGSLYNFLKQGYNYNLSNSKY